MEPTPEPRLDRAVAELRAAVGRWPRVGLRERVGFLEACAAGVAGIAGEWAARACTAQGIVPGSRLSGENWLSGPCIALRDLRLLAAALRTGGHPCPPSLREVDGRYVARVVPEGRLERLLYRGIEAELRITPGQEPTQGRIYREPASSRPPGGVGLVLGAGNVSAIAVRDLLHELFVEDRVVVLKMHPVNEYLGALFEAAFAPLIEAGYLAIVYGGADVGRYLCRHQGVDTIHLTGSHHTHDAIVWGDGPEERARRRAADDPVVTKPVTAELGCVSPVIVTPGEWTDEELDHQARSVAGMVTHNASFNCNAAKLVVTSSDWPQRETFLRFLARILAATPTRTAYYPGAAARYERFRNDVPSAEPLGGDPPEGHLPWTLATGVAAEAGSPVLGREAFCGVLAETALPAADAGDFLAAAVAFCNRDVWGSLSAMLLVDPRTERRLGPRVAGAIDDLRYGGVAVNCWSGLLFGLCAPSWGAFPGNDRRAVGSGIGQVGGNTYLFDHPCQSVVRTPFRTWPKPLWFADHRTLGRLGRTLTGYEASPGWRRLPRLAALAARA